VAEHSTNNPKINGSNPATCTGREKMAKKERKTIKVLLLLLFAADVNVFFYLLSLMARANKLECLSQKSFFRQQ
jgi:hypothetical protein